MSVYHVWPCDTWCSEEDLEEYLHFMSDDYITIKVVDEPEDYEVPSYNEAVENGLVYKGVGAEGKGMKFTFTDESELDYCVVEVDYESV